MRLLLTGGTGFVARALLEQLLPDTQVHLSLLIRPDSPNLTRLDSLLHEFPGRVKLYRADLRDAGSLADVVGDCRPDRLIHLASAGVTNPNLAIPVALAHNLQGTLNLIDACFNGQNPPEQLIVARTPGEHNAMNVYAASKAAAWAFCRMAATTRGLPIAGAMIYQAYGPGQSSSALIPSAAAAALAGADFPMTSGVQLRDWIQVEDVAAGLIATLCTDLAPGATVDLGTGRPTSVADVVAAIYQIAAAGGQPLIGAVPNRAGEDSRQVADAEASREMIQWQAKIPLAQGLAQLLQSFE